MKKTFIVIISFLLFVTVLLVCAEAAEQRGFIVAPIQQTQEKKENVCLRSNELEMSNQRNSKKEQKQFIENYDYEQKCSQLKRVLKSKENRIAVLENELLLAKAKTRKLEAELSADVTYNQKQYEVKKGDSLWRIAQRSMIYGNGLLWVKIYNANMDRIKNPDLIFPGQIFTIPE